MKPCDCVERHAPRRGALRPRHDRRCRLLERAYNQDNPLRIESMAEASAVDDRILQQWSVHPHRVVVDATEDFLSKASQVLRLLRDEVPECCRHHVRTFLWDGYTRARRLAARAGEQA